jgi:hypothetical protein
VCLYDGTARRAAKCACRSPKNGSQGGTDLAPARLLAQSLQKDEGQNWRLCSNNKRHETLDSIPPPLLTFPLPPLLREAQHNWPHRRREDWRLSLAHHLPTLQEVRLQWRLQ